MTPPPVSAMRPPSEPPVLFQTDGEREEQREDPRELSEDERIASWYAGLGLEVG